MSESKQKKKRELPKGWNYYCVGDFADTSSGGTPLSTKKEYYENGDIPWVNSGEVNQARIKKAEKFITMLGLENSNAKVFSKNTVLVAMYGATAGKTSILDIAAATNQAICGILPNENYNSDFLKYSLDFLYEYLVGISSGSARDNLSQTGIQQLIIPMPDLPTQKKIAGALSALDAKIELNQRINTELETMAKTLYDYWFVQFDFPNEKGQPYKSSGGKMAWNEKLSKYIPEGWQVKPLCKVLKTNLGGTPSTMNPEYWENATIPWLNSGDLSNFPIISSNAFITKKGVDNSATTVLQKGSVVISLVRYIRPSIVAFESCANQSVVGICESEELKNTFIYPYLVNEVPRFMKLRTGAQQPHINKEIIDESLLCVPQKELLEKYYKITEPIYKKIFNTAFESQTLTELRDWLLPMLMNGQVTVKSLSN